MSLTPPSLWIEQRGLQHRVYWRNGVPGQPTRSYVVVAAVLSEPPYSSASRWKSKWSRHCPAMRR